MLYFNACTSLQPIVQDEKIEDLEVISQDPSFYTKRLKTEYIGDIKSFKDNYYRPWNIEQISIDQQKSSWAYIYDNNRSYTYTLQPIESNFFKNIKENSNLEEFATLNNKAISVTLLNIRALPTDKPIFLDPAKAGEGYPFDYLQNATLAPNKPLLISHYSKDKKWAFIECSFGFGWVKVKNIALINEEEKSIWQNAQQVFLTKDNYPFYDQEGNYLFNSRIGMVLPMLCEDEQNYTVALKSKNSPLLQIKIPKDLAHKNLMEFHSSNVAAILKELENGKYGWGGIYGQRDCSSTLRDFYTPFGVWLPRNSYPQSKVGDVIELERFSNEEKENIIQEYAIPFKTLVYKKGHIALYVGTIDNKVIIFQNVWGVKTKENGIKGRFLIAKPIFSTLEVGKNLHHFDPTVSMLSQLKSINTLMPLDQAVCP